MNPAGIQKRPRPEKEEREEESPKRSEREEKEEESHKRGKREEESPKRSEREEKEEESHKRGKREEESLKRSEREEKEEESGALVTIAFLYDQTPYQHWTQVLNRQGFLQDSKRFCHLIAVEMRIEEQEPFIQLNWLKQELFKKSQLAHQTVKSQIQGWMRQQHQRKTFWDPRVEFVFQNKQIEEFWNSDGSLRIEAVFDEKLQDRFPSEVLQKTKTWGRALFADLQHAGAIAIWNQDLFWTLLEPVSQVFSGFFCFWREKSHDLLDRLKQQKGPFFAVTKLSLLQNNHFSTLLLAKNPHTSMLEKSLKLGFLNSQIEETLYLYLYALLSCISCPIKKQKQQQLQPFEIIWEPLRLS